MAQLHEVLQLVELAAFVGLAAASMWQWRRRGGSAAGWLAATFSTLAGVVLVDRLLPEQAVSEAALWLNKLVIAVLALFPYFLYRFTVAVAAGHRLMTRLAGALTGAVVVWSLLLPRVPVAGEQRSAGFNAFVASFVVVWTLLSGVAVVRLWRAGAAEPRVARARMRLLASGAVALNLALLLAGLAETARPDVFQLAIDVSAVAAAALLFLGFVPPASLRALWRRPVERALREAQLELAAAMTSQQVTEAMLPFLRRVFGAGGAFAFDMEGDLSAVHGMEVTEAHAIAAALTEGKPADQVMAVRLRSGWIGVRTTPFTPYFGSDEIQLLKTLAVFIDLALERAMLFERERRARVEIEHARGELEALLLGISHDLKNPVVTLLGYLDLLQTDYGERLGDEGQHFLHRMAVSALYVQQLLEDLLELSRVGRTQMDAEALDLEALVEDIARETRRNYALAKIAVGALPRLIMNRARARQLFTNLIENAVRHGGRQDVTIEVDSVAFDDGSVQMAVSDDGRGIPPPYRERVFGIFERLGASTAGTGIGLAICRKIVEMTGGTIRLADVEVGTRVEMLFPQSLVAAPPDSEAER